MKRWIGGLLSAMMIVSLLGASAVSAASVVPSRTVRQDMTLQEDTQLQGTMTVREGATLVIPSGVTLTLDPGAALKVEGAMEVFGRVIVPCGARVYMKENGSLQELIGPASDMQTGHVPLVAMEIGSVTLGDHATAFSYGSLARIARSGALPYDQVWYLLDEVSLIYEENVSLDVSIQGPDTTIPGNKNMMDKLEMLEGSSNKTIGAKGYSIYWWLGWLEGSQPASWREFNFDQLADFSNDFRLIGENPLLLVNTVLPWRDSKSINGMEIVPGWSSQDGEVYSDLVYDDSRNQHNLYDLYIPKGTPKDETVGVILFIHGGGWTDGAKEDMTYECCRYARQGYVTATLDYRMFSNTLPTGTTEDMMEIVDDVGNCIRAVKEKLVELGYTPDRLALSGYSAGGHLAMFYGFARADESAIPVKLIFQQCGPSDMHKETYGDLIWMKDFPGGREGKLAPFIGVEPEDLKGEISQETEEKIARISPVNYITPNSCPIVYQYGRFDQVIGQGHEPLLEAALKKNGVEYRSIPAYKSNHYLELDKEALAEFHQVSAEYLKKYLGQSRPVEVTAQREDGCPTAGYADVPANAWYHEYADYVVSRQLMMGTDKGFEPEIPVTRAMMVQILHAMEGRPAAFLGSQFGDVVNGAWYAEAVNWAAKNQIVGGFEDGNFHPDENITREQMASILRAYAGYRGGDTTASAELRAYSDAGQVSNWAQEAMKWATAHVLIAGRDGAMLVPQGHASRAEVATMITAFCREFSL